MLADNLRRYRELNNLSQEEVANAIGVTQGAVGNWERGLKPPSVANLVALSELFKVSLDQLVKSESKEENSE